MTITERIHRANAAVECEKIMSRHVYLHAGGVHREEIEEYWTKGDSCTWAHNFGQMGDRENYIKCYADRQEQDTKNVYDEVVKVYPEVKEVAEMGDYRALCEEAMHFTVSPIVEVAQDGMSAKGLFYTPGCIFSTLNPQQAREGTWIWERYSADFVYEDGRWLYLNLKVCCDLNGPMDRKQWPMTVRMPVQQPEEETEIPTEGGKQSIGQGPVPVTHPGPLHYECTSAQLPQERPFIPVPYTTFAETYNYASLTGIYED